MPPTSETRLRVIHAAYALMYLIATLAGIYGLFRPAGQVQALYGSAGNRTMLVLITIGGVLGMGSYLFQLLRLELLGAPILTCAVAFIAPALFYSEVREHQTAWYGWLTLTLGVSFVARWIDVRHLLESQRRARYRARHKT
jgi:hypothetical protein